MLLLFKKLFKTSMYASGKYHEFFDNPDEFKPERFILTDSEAENLYWFKSFKKLKINFIFL